MNDEACSGTPKTTKRGVTAATSSVLVERRTLNASWHPGIRYPSPNVIPDRDCRQPVPPIQPGNR